MNVDEAGRAAGRAMRERFDEHTAPSLDVRPVRRPPRGRAVLAGLVVAVAATLVALALPWPSANRGDGGGGTWRRARVRDIGFGANGRPWALIAGGPGFVAYGSVRHPERYCVAVCDEAAIWTSADGEQWARVPRALLPRFGTTVTTIVRHGLLLLALVEDASGAQQVWSSYGARQWTGPDDEPTTAPFRSARVRLFAARDGFLAVETEPIGTTSQQQRVWRSSTGRQWAAVARRGTGTTGRVTALAPVRDHNVALTEPDLMVEERHAVIVSRDASRWERVAAPLPARTSGPWVPSRDRRRVLGIQYEEQGTFGGRLWSTRDGRRWDEIKSFHAQMPIGNPDHLAQSGSWWVLGGNTGTPDGMRRASMWTTPDLRHWYEMPAHLRGHRSSGSGMVVAATRDRALGISQERLWIWTPP